MAVTADTLKAKRLAVLEAQKALGAAQFDLQQAQVQQQIEALAPQATPAAE